MRRLRNQAGNVLALRLPRTGRAARETSTGDRARRCAKALPNELGRRVGGLHGPAAAPLNPGRWTCSPMFEEELTRLTFTTLCVCLPSVPVTHILGLVAHSPSSIRPRQLLLYPFKGGRTHTIFQLISWVIWMASVLVAIPLLAHKHIPAAHVELLSGAAAIGGVFAEFFLINSLLVWDPKAPSMSLPDEDDDELEPKSPQWRRGLPSKRLSSALVVLLGLLWAVMGFALLLATEYLDSVTTKVVYFVMSGACLLIGATTTHGLGGELHHSGYPGFTEAQPSWRFFQPFQGGVIFVATQALGWALFSAALVSLIWLISLVASGVAYCIRCWALATGGVMFAAQVVLAASLWTFRGKPGAQSVLRTAAVVRRSPLWLPIFIMYCPAQVLCAALVITFSALPLGVAGGLWAGGLLLYYVSTSRGEPQHTGRREWPAFREWMGRSLPAAIATWIGPLEVVYDGQAKLDPHKKYVFGYHPHGLFPIGAPYLPLLPAFRALFPGLAPVPLVASVCFHAPLIRDLVSWCGVRQVARRTFLAALAQRGAVVLVPGGQAELVQTWRLARRRELVIYTRHRGFVRLAAEQGAALVPVAVLGEIDTLCNFVDLPDIQRWTYKKLGFPLPYLVVGRWGWAPLPRATALKFVIGEPLAPPQPAAPGHPVDEAVVDELHKRYYDAVEALFRKHQPGFKQYHDVKLVMDR